MTGGDAPILLVEDEPELGLVLQETIEEWDRRVLLVPSGSEAMRVLAEVPVGLLLLDWQLADMSGAELLDRLPEAFRARRSVQAAGEDPSAPLTARRHPFAAAPFPTQHSTGAV